MSPLEILTNILCVSFLVLLFKYDLKHFSDTTEASYADHALVPVDYYGPFHCPQGFSDKACYGFRVALLDTAH